MSYGLLNETNNVKKKAAGDPKTFTFNKEKYKELEEQGFYFEIK